MEAPRLRGLGVQEQAPATDLPAQHMSPGDHVLEQPDSDATTLVTDVDTQTSEEGDRLTP